MTVRNLLRVTGLLEGGTAMALLLLPAIPLQLLFGQAPATEFGLLVGRLAGAALLSLAIACWWAAAASDVVRAMLLYNAVIIGLLLHARIGLGLSGIALWPVLIVHALLAGWCVVGLRH